MRVVPIAPLVFALVAAGCGPPPLAPGRRVVVAYPYAPASLDPRRAYEELSMSVLGNVYETLVEVRPGRGLHPRIAESWHSPDDRTWVFRIRDGVRLHDGRSLEASHVAQALLRSRDDPASARRADLASVESVTAPDARTLIVRTRQPVATLAARLSHVLIAADPLVSGGQPVGTGPYRLTSWSVESTTLEVFALHRDGPASVASIEFRAVPDVRDRVRLLREGRVDLIVDVPADEFGALAADDRLCTAEREGKRVLFLGLDTRHAPFRDPRVRRAVASALDRDRLVAGPLGGFGVAATQLATSDVMGYNPDVVPPAVDLPRSRALLEEAGYPSGFTTRLDYIEGKYRGMDALVGAIVAELAASGIRVEPRPQNVAQFIDRLMRRDTSLFLAGVLNDTGDASASYEYLLHTPGGGLGWLNGGDYSDPELDALMREATRLDRSEERARLLRRIAARVAAELPVIPLVVPADLYAFRRGLRFEPEPSRRIRAAGLHWDADERLVSLPAVRADRAVPE